MKSLFALFYAVTAVTPVYAEKPYWYQPPIYLQPGEGGRWSTKPPPAPSVAHGVRPRAPTPQNPVRPPTGGSSQSPHDANRDSNLAADIAGGRAIYEAEYAEKERKRYEQQLDYLASLIRKYFAGQPRLKKELGAQSAVRPLGEFSARENEQADDYDKSGEALVLQEFTDEGAVEDLLNHNGVPVSRGSEREEAGFRDIYDRFVQEEYKFQSDLIKMGRDTTKPMLEKSDQSRSAGERAAAELGEVKPAPATPVPPPQTPPDASLAEIAGKLARARPDAPQAQQARAVGEAAVEAAQRAYASGDSEAGDFYKDAAAALAGVAIGFVPVAGEVQAIYEALTGKNMITGESLSRTERALAMAGVVSAGIAPSLAKMGQWGYRVAANTRGFRFAVSRAQRVLARVAESKAGRILANERGAIGDWRKVDHLLTESQRARLKSVTNILNDHAKESDFTGVMKERMGEKILKRNGDEYQHAYEMITSEVGLRNHLRALENSLKNPNLRPEVRATIEEHVAKGWEARKRMGKALND